MEDRYLFKAKRTDNGEWVKGALVYDGRDKLYRIITEINYSTGTCLTTDNAPRVDKSTICQCTGLKDENDKLIWENDIIRCKVGTAKVIWDKSEWRIEWLKNDLWRKDLYYWAVEDIQRVVVIGNIFNNPESLESEKK
jgi:uncharacterized phage protein (TIGR01671 family)|uniref:YopX protein n=1 Tax=virus sp. ctCsQ3 TaxID=2826794 RepID=A0A8S5R6V6_9VIRU|nr:MAG TPA: YopX protein [virus sp. ctCsQ3]